MQAIAPLRPKKAKNIDRTCPRLVASMQTVIRTDRQFRNLTVQLSYNPSAKLEDIDPPVRLTADISLWQQPKLQHSLLAVLLHFYKFTLLY